MSQDPLPRETRWAVTLAVVLAALYVATAVAGGFLSFDVLRGLAACALVLVVSWGLGSAALRWLTAAGDEESASVSEQAFAVVLGLGSLSAAGLGVGLVHAYRPLVLVAILVAGLPLAARQAIRLRRARRGPESRAADFARLARAVAWLLGGITFLAALPPATWFDAIEYHVVLPSVYLLEGGIVNLPHVFFSHFPHLFQLGSGFVLALDPEAPVALLNWAAAACAVIGAGSVSERLVPGSRWAAVALVISSRTLAGTCFSPGVDAFMAALVVFGVDRVLRSRDDPRHLPAALLAAGLLLASKVHAPISVAVLVTVFVSCRVSWRSLWSPRAGCALALALALPLPFFLRTWLAHGSPVWPFLDPGGATGDWTRAVVAYTRDSGIDGGSLAELPGALMGAFLGDQGWHAGVLVGLIGASFFGLFRRREARAVGLALLVFGTGWVLGARQLRYALPAVPLLAALAGAGARLALAACNSRRARIAFSAAFAAPVLVASASVSLEVYNARDFFGFVAGVEDRMGYLERSVPQSPHAVILRANVELAPEARIVSFDEPRVSELRRRHVAATAFDRPLLREMLAAGERLDADRPTALWKLLRERGVTHVLTNRAYAETLRGKLPGLLVRTEDDQRVLDELLARHANLLFGRNGAALFELHP